MLVHLIAIRFNEPQVKYREFESLSSEDRNLPLPTEEDLRKTIEGIQKTLMIDESAIREIIIHLVSGKNVILSGPTGTGKTHLATLLPKLSWTTVGGYYSLVYTATGDWTTQDVIGGIQPKLDRDEQVVYRIHKGCVYEAVSRNWHQQEDGRLIRCKYTCEEGTYSGVWLVIDEFNRANIDRAFGEMFTAIEYHALKVPTTNTEKSFEETQIPKDFRIISTLNTFDKHYLFKLSDALKRRFAFVEILPPARNLAEKEKYYALNRSINLLKGTISDSKLRMINLDSASKKIIRDQPDSRINKALDDAFDILSFIRLSKNLGTASLIALYSYIIIDNQSSDADFDKSLDAALRSTIIPQLENVPRWSVEAIQEFCFGDIVAFLKGKKQDDFGYSKYVEEFSKLMKYLNKDEIHRRTTAFQEGRILEETWDSYNPWAGKTRPNLPQFRQALDELIRELEIM